MSVLWEIWLERNDQVFNRHQSSIPTSMTKIKSEASTWIVAREKGLATLAARL
jgi:hypothetical protein